MVGEHGRENSVVYVLGAGASRAVIPTAPLMADLLPEILNIYKQRQRCSETNDDIRVYRIMEFINDFYQLPDGKLPRLEDILAQLDLALEEDRPLSKHYTLSLLRQLREDLVYALCEVLRKTLSDEQRNDQSREVMRKFLQMLGPKDCILSLNYDIIVDNAIFRQMGQVDYGLSIRYAFRKGGEPDPYKLDLSTNKPPLYKLHGSLNWVYCPQCQHLDVTIGTKGVRYIYILEKDSDFICPDCRGKYEPLIITPTLLKSYRNVLLREVWRQAEDKISKADEVVFVGYSMPDADVQLRCMFKRALYTNRIKLQSETRGPSGCTIYVVGNRELPNDVYDRYLQLFSEVNYEATGFAAYIERRFEDYKKWHIHPSSTLEIH